MNYKAIIFDYGNTLVTGNSLVSSLESVLANQQAKKIGQAIEAEISKLYRPEQKVQPDWLGVWQRCFELNGLEFSERIARQHLQNFCQQAKTLPNVQLLLKELKAQGFKLALLSNITGPADIFQQDIESRQLAEYFDVIVWSSVIGYRKPEKQAFQYTLNQLEVSAHDTLMVGDSEIADIAGAARVGIDAALISSNKQVETKAKFCIRPDHIRADFLQKIIADL